MQVYRTSRTTAAAGMIALGGRLVGCYQQSSDPKPTVGFELEVPDDFNGRPFDEVKDLLLKGGHGVSVDLGKYTLARAELTNQIRQTERGAANVGTE